MARDTSRAKAKIVSLLKQGYKINLNTASDFTVQANARLGDRATQNAISRRAGTGTMFQNAPMRLRRKGHA